MYIAFKWLIFMSLLMWGFMCVVDVYFHKNVKENQGPTRLSYTHENITISRKKQLLHKVRHRYNVGNKFISPSVISVFHIVMFLFGATLVTFINKTNSVFIHIRRLLIRLDLEHKLVCLVDILNNIHTNPIWKNVKKYWSQFIKKAMVKLNNMKNRIVEIIDCSGCSIIEEHEIECEILIDKLKEAYDEKKNLNQLLIAAIEESKDLKLKFQLESMAKERLLKHIEDTNKQIKDHRTRYINFQNLYLVTHQENIFLKARIRKITKEKNDTENNLMMLLEKVYDTKNSELRAYCSRFIVGTKSNLLNSDVTTEINTFMQTKSPFYITTRYNYENIDTDIIVTELSRDCESLNVPIKTTVIKENGKIHLDNNEFCYDNQLKVNILTKGDIYFNDMGSNNKLNSMTSGKKFLTESAAFKNFMRNNTNLVPRVSSTGTLPLCG